jgi:hypothetical protein
MKYCKKLAVNGRTDERREERLKGRRRDRKEEKQRYQI